MPKPYFKNQLEDVETLTRDADKALFLSPGLGKSRITIDSTARHVRAGLIDTMVVCAPASARSVWADPSPHLGEVAKWWDFSVPLTPIEFRNGTELPPSREGLTVVVTNPEMIRREEHLGAITSWLKGRRATYVHDESWNVSNPTAQQTKAACKLADACIRRYILNGTPGSPDKLYSQYRIFGKERVFPGIRNWWQYRAAFCKMGGFQNHDIVGFQNMDRWKELTSPFTILREGRPAGVDTPLRTQIDVALTPRTWKIYQDMRRTLVAELSSRDVAVAPSAAVKLLRLAQIVNGFVGGVEASMLSDEEDRPVLLSDVREVGREKLDGVLAWLKTISVPDKVVFFNRFRPDVERTERALAAEFPLHEVSKLYGGQTERERTRTKTLFAPGGAPEPAMAVVNAQSGGAGLNLAQAWLTIFLGNDFSDRRRKQAEGRIDRPGQTGRPWFVDVIASGPKGERTVDHIVLAAQRAEQDVSAWTAGQWKEALTAGA